MLIVKSKMKWVVLIGLLLSIISLISHFFLAIYTDNSFNDQYQTSITIFSWRPVFHNAHLLSKTSSVYKRLWGPVKVLESVHPYANPRGRYEAPDLHSNGFIFIRIQGGFHEIRNSVCDAVVIARLLNATLVIPELQSTTSSKGISSAFKSFGYLYNEEQFIATVSKDIMVVKTLPKKFRWARRKKEIPVFRVTYSTSTEFYLHRVLPILKGHSVVELSVADGGCLQAILPPHLEEYQRLRCRVAFHALKFRHEVQELAHKILNRLQAFGRPFIAFDPGMTRDALAYHGCSELFQDVHTQLIQHRRSWMIKRGIVKGELYVDSMEQRLNGSCPLMPEEVGILLRTFGYSSDTIIYVSGGEVFGGQRSMVPLHAMFDNVVDRTSLTTVKEITTIYGREGHVGKTSRKNPPIQEEVKLEVWKTAGPRPRPLPPPPARPKYPYNIEGWWGWVAESDNEPDSTVAELRANAHKLLWEAIDYVICVEAEVYIPAFDRDGRGRPNVASMVMGHRFYQSAASKTYRLDRKKVAKFFDDIRDHLYQANHTWLASIRKHLSGTLLDGLTEAEKISKQLSFLTHPVPECSCLKHNNLESSSNSSAAPTTLQLKAAIGVIYKCPTWIDNIPNSLPSESKDNQDDLEEEDPSSQLFRWNSIGNDVGGVEPINKEIPIEDQEELENTDK